MLSDNFQEPFAKWSCIRYTIQSLSSEGMGLGPQRIKEKAFTPRVRKPLSEIAFIVEEVSNGIV